MMCPRPARAVALALLAASCAPAPGERPPATGSIDGGTPDAGGAEIPMSPVSATGDPDPGVAVTLTPPARGAEAARLFRTMTADAPTTAAAFADRWRPRHAPSLGYDPLRAQNMDLLQASHIKLNDAELAVLGRDGFVISGRQAFPTFFYGYKTIYADDLPVFISADSILHAVHRSFDDMLSATERDELVPALDSLLSGLHRNLGRGAGAQLPAATRADVDLYLTVARRLLAPAEDDASPMEPTRPVAGAAAADVDELVARVLAADRLERVPLLGDAERIIDFSQFRPRGHYDSSMWPQLRRYFRTMMWLGRTDLRLMKLGADGAGVFQRRQFLAALLLAALTDDQARGHWDVIERTLRGFFGESDNMTLLDFDRLRSQLGARALLDLAALPDQRLAQAIVDGDFGIQRIASQVIMVPPDGANLPLDRVFLFLGQRFAIDSEVLSNVVFDRVLPQGGPQRMLPDPLDVAFAALGNTHAAPLLSRGLVTYKNYPAALHRARTLVDAHEPAFWSGSLYSAWLGALRAMSPPADLTTDGAKSLPAVARTEAWARRVLNTQLASWAELRHDTLLYTKQSYTSFPTCEFPDAYVDPHPELWAALARFGERGAALPGRWTGYFAGVRQVALRLEDMARRQITGTPFTAEQLAWVNEAVRFHDQQFYAGKIEVPEGWYVKLFANGTDVTQMDPTIADVHTNPGEGQVLHAATGLPRLMVVTAETCQGPRAYAGLASAYHEVVTNDLRRLTDEEWAAQRKDTADVPWMKDLVQR